jgi:hypothetical protein
LKPFNGYAAFPELQNAGNYLQCGRLARAVGAQQTCDLCAADFKRKPVQHFRAIVPKLQTFDMNTGH